MLYEQYNKKMKRVAAFVSRVKRYRIPIIIFFVLLVATVMALLGTRGIVSDSAPCPSQFVYGEGFSYKASAFLGDVEYEFRADGESTWTKEQPVRAGKYCVRAVSERTFGGYSYGKVYEFTIVPKPLDITVAAAVEYGEKPEISASLVYGDSMEVGDIEYDDLSKTETDVRVAVDSVVITDADGNDVTSSYAINAVKGHIVFSARDIEITVADVTAEYNGKPLTSSAWELTSGELAEGDRIVPVFDKSQTDVGETENTPQISVTHKVLNDDGIDVSANYRIAQKVGKLTVQKRTVVIDTDDDFKEYDGSALTCGGYKVSDETPIVDGDRLEIALGASQTDVGIAENIIVFKVYNSDGNEVTDNYSFVVNAGTLEVTPREITVKTADDKKIYDGKELKNKGFKVDGKNVVAGHSLSVAADVGITDVGKQLNALGFVVLAADGETDVSDNYKITVECGTLEVTQRTVKITTLSKEWDYDGGAHSCGEFTVDATTADEGLIGDHSVEAVKLASVCDVIFDDDGEVTSIDNIIEFKVVGGDAANYKLDITYGTLTVNKRKITVEMPTESLVYNGKAQHSSAPVIAESSENALVLEQEISVNMYTERTEVGAVDNVIDFDIVKLAVEDDTAVDTRKTENYDIAVIDGKLTVTKRPITFTAGDAKKEYDGGPLTNTVADNYTVNSGNDVGLAEGQTVTATFTGSLTDAGKEKINEISAVVIYAASDASKTPLNDNYDITFENGYLEVTARAVSVTTDGNKWTYDGGAHYEEGFTAERLLDGHTLTVATHTEIIDVAYDEDDKVIGVDNKLTFNVVGTLSANYDIKIVEYGKLVIEPRPVTVTTATREWVYDGKGHSDHTLTVAIETPLVAGHVAAWISATVFTHVAYDKATGKQVIGLKNDVCFNIVSASDMSKDPPNRTALDGNYDINAVYGTITIKPRPVTIVTPDDSFEYDGTEKQSVPSDIAVASDSPYGLADDDEILPSALWVKSDLLTDKDIYTGRVEAGNSRNVITVVIGSRVEHKTAGLWKDRVYFPNGRDLIEDKEDRTDDYAITYRYGTLNVAQRKITVKAQDATKVYNGKPTACEFEITSNTLAPNQYGVADYNAEYTNTGTYTACVVTDFKVYKDKSDDDVTANYEITYDSTGATLIISKRPLTLASYGSEDDSEFYLGTYWYYDGTEKSFKYCGFKYEADENGNPHPDKGMIFEWGNATYPDGTIIDSTAARAYRLLHTVVPDEDSWSTITDAGSCDNEFTAKLFDADGNDVTANYDITYIYGTLIVKPRPITVVSDSAEWVFDGQAHYIESWRYGEGSLEFVLDHGLNITSHFNEVTYVSDGEKDNILTFEFVNGNPNNYDITYKYGTIKILVREIQLIMASNEWEYDGEWHSDKNWSYAEGSLEFLEGHYLEITNSPEVRDVNRDDDGKVVAWVNCLMGYRYVDENGNLLSAEIRSSYKTDQPEYGKLLILPVGLNVITFDDDKIYDGTPLVGGNAAITGLKDGYTIVMKSLDVSITDVAESGAVNAAEVDFVLDKDGNDITANCEIFYQLGTLTVFPREITVETATNEWVYDGVSHFDDRFALVDGTLVDGHELVLVEYVTIKDVGEINNGLVLAVMRGNVDKTSNYTVKFNYGTLTVTDDGSGGGEGGGEGGGNGPVMNVKSDVTATVYLREMSFGDYTGKVSQYNNSEKNWAAAHEYSGQKINYDGKNYSVNYLTSIVMQSNGIATNNIEVELLGSAGNAYSLPYYLTLSDENRQESDVMYSAAVKEYSATHYMYDYTSDNGAALASTDLGIYKRIEADYREFVYANYTSVRESTAAYMQGIIDARKFKKDDPAVISKVAKYVRTSAKYNPQYNTAIADEDDVAVAFLDKYKEGVCVHYATAATVLFRTLGFPARYTTGFKVDAQAGKWVVVSEGHAWVEVYLDGIGWIEVEVTGSMEGGDSGGGEGEGGGEGGGERKELLAIKPVDVTREYNGKPLFAEQEVESALGDDFTNLIELGYYYTVEVAGSRIDVGISESTITAFTLFDPSGNNVTDNYRIEYGTGIIWVTKTQIKVVIPYISKVYDGTPIVFEELFPDYYGYYWDELPDSVGNIVIDMRKYEGFTNVGKKNATELAIEFEALGACHVYSTTGEDVTDNYTVLFEGGGLEITKREILITTHSAEKVYDGTPLTYYAYDIGGQKLVNGHSIDVTFSGSIIDIGTTLNSIAFVRITDAEGNIVDDNYTVKLINGTLTVTP